MDVILHNEPGRGHSFAATVPCGYTVKHRMIHAHDRIPTVGVDKYGPYAANPHLWGTMDELYLTGFSKPNHPVPVPFNYGLDLLMDAELAIDGYYNPYAG